MAAVVQLVTETDWRGSLRRRGEHFAGDELNVLTALRQWPEVKGLVRFNEFAGRVEFARQPSWRAVQAGDRWTEPDDFDLHALLQSQQIEVRNRGIVADAVERVARDTPHHPVRQYLTGLKWDLTSRLETWLADYLGAAGSDIYLAAAGSKFLISAVARIMQPGCKADHVLVLEGAQGIGKTRTHRILFAPWFADSLPAMTDKDAALQLQGVWGVELSELAAMRGTSQVEVVKSFLTRTHDRFRPPYGRRTVEVPRQCVFLGTTNESQYLRDPTGNRRFWPVRCTAINLVELAIDRDQLLAEALAAYQSGVAWHLDADEALLATSEQAERQLVTELEQAVSEYLDRILANGTREITTREILTGACALEFDKPDYMERAGRLGPGVAATLERRGWRRVGQAGRSPNRRTVYRYTGTGSQGLTPGAGS